MWKITPLYDAGPQLRVGNSLLIPDQPLEGEISCKRCGIALATVAEIDAALERLENGDSASPPGGPP
jgi:hypothetical protein